MKKKLLLVLVLILALCISMLITGCGGSNEQTADPAETAETNEQAETEEPADTETPDGEPADEPTETTEPAETSEPEAPLTFEEFAKNDSSIQDKIGVDESSGVSVAIEGNELIYTYDFSKMDGDYKEETIKSDDVKNALKDALAENGATFGNIAKVMEEASGIEGVSVVVEYTWEGDEVFSQTFTSADAE